MTWTTREIESVAMRLPAHERARLAERLLISLDEDAEIEEVWAEEVRKRLEDYRSGGPTPVSGTEVFADARARLRRR
jgi:putative addiction module component (TIGR02574 family)